MEIKIVKRNTWPDEVILGVIECKADEAVRVPEVDAMKEAGTDANFRQRVWLTAKRYGLRVTCNKDHGYYWIWATHTKSRAGRPSKNAAEISG